MNDQAIFIEFFQLFHSISYDDSLKILGIVKAEMEESTPNYQFCYLKQRDRYLLSLAYYLINHTNAIVELIKASKVCIRGSETLLEIVLLSR